jgi:alkylation response protein AidB-like acyl-CoA dehydrogenase
MSLAAVIDLYFMLSRLIWRFGTTAQRQCYCSVVNDRRAPRLIEMNAGRCRFGRRGHATHGQMRWREYIENGARMFMTNGERSNTFAVLATTDGDCSPLMRAVHNVTVMRFQRTGDAGHD